jgi:hypothetical protein
MVREVAVPVPVLNVVPGLRERSACYSHEVCEGAGFEATEALRDIARRRARRISNLLAELRVSGDRPALSQPEDLVTKLRTQLPRIQVFVALSSDHKPHGEHSRCHPNPPTDLAHLLARIAKFDYSEALLPGSICERLELEHLNALNVMNA